MMSVIRAIALGRAKQFPYGEKGVLAGLMLEFKQIYRNFLC